MAPRYRPVDRHIDACDASVTHSRSVITKAESRTDIKGAAAIQGSQTKRPVQKFGDLGVGMAAEGLTRRMRPLLGNIKLGNHVNLSIHLADF